MMCRFLFEKAGEVSKLAVERYIPANQKNHVLIVLNGFYGATALH